MYFIKGILKDLNKIYDSLFAIKEDIDKLENKGFGILSDRDIRLRIHELFSGSIKDECIQPASVDLHLDKTLKTFQRLTSNDEIGILSFVKEDKLIEYDYSMFLRKFGFEINTGCSCGCC